MNVNALRKIPEIALPDWLPCSGKIVYDNKWIRLIETEVRDREGKRTHKYSIVHFKNFAIGIVPLTQEKEIYLVGQYRYPISMYSWEIPEGGGSLYVPPIDSAMRELKEETGLIARKWKHLLNLHLSNSATDELAIVFLAWDLSQENPEPEETENIHVKKMPLKMAFKMVMEGHITDAISVAAILKTTILEMTGELDRILNS